MPQVEFEIRGRKFVVSEEKALINAPEHPLLITGENMECQLRMQELFEKEIERAGQ